MNLKTMFMAVALLLVASPAFAGADANWIAVTSGFSMAIASGLCALGQGKATAAAAEAWARNPAAAAGIRFCLIFGLALIESLALYTLVILFLKVA
ncbi:MAG: ATPase [Acidobacteria bacterium]|nr:ATPase [Acidobacteriota bacterium]